MLETGWNAFKGSKPQALNKAEENKAQWVHHQHLAADKEQRPPTVSDGPVQTKKEGHLAA